MTVCSKVLRVIVLSGNDEESGVRFASQEAQESAELVEEYDEGGVEAVGDYDDDDRFELEIVPIGASNASVSCLNGLCEEDAFYPTEAIDAVMRRHGSFG